MSPSIVAAPDRLSVGNTNSVPAGTSPCLSSTYGFSSEKIGTNHVTRRSEVTAEIIDQSRPSRLGGRFRHSLVDGLLQ